MIELAQVLEAARALSTEEQDILVDRLLEWRAEAERGDVPVWVCEEELALVRRGLAAAERGETVDARTFMAELRKQG